MTRGHGGAARRLLLVLPILAIALALAPCAWAGSLVLGKPTIQDGQYTFPVSLNGADNQVSSIDFRVQFDPSVFQPVNASAGNSALAANKMVTANYANPGEYVVVMMGLNQSVVPGGPVASVVLQRVGDASATGSTQVAITDPTLAAPDGSELQASGSAFSVNMGGDKGTPESETPSPAPAKDDTTGAAASPATPQTANPGAPQSTPAKGLATRPQPGVDMGGVSVASAAQSPSTVPGMPAVAAPGAIAANHEHPESRPASEGAATANDTLASASADPQKKFSTIDQERVHNKALGKSERPGVASSTQLASATIESPRKLDPMTAPAAPSASGAVQPQGDDAMHYGLIGGAVLAAIMFAALLLRRSFVR